MAENLGRPPHEPTKETRLLVQELTAFGITQEKIARRLNICIDTLALHYRDELDNGKTDAVLAVGKSLYSKAVEQDDLGAQVFYLKTQGGWREKDKDDDTKKAWSVIEQLLAMKKDGK